MVFESPESFLKLVSKERRLKLKGFPPKMHPTFSLNARVEELTLRVYSSTLALS